MCLVSLSSCSPRRTTPRTLISFTLLPQWCSKNRKKQRNKSSSFPLKSYLQIQKSDYACHTTAFFILRDFHSSMELLLAWSIRGDRTRSPSMATLPPTTSMAVLLSSLHQQHFCNARDATKLHQQKALSAWCRQGASRRARSLL